MINGSFESFNNISNTGCRSETYVHIKLVFIFKVKFLKYDIFMLFQNSQKNQMSYNFFKIC